jgi:hypothetical protein
MFILTEGGKSTYSARDDGSALWVRTWLMRTWRFDAYIA